VYLDGRLNRTVDSNSDEEQSKTSEAVWHAFGLTPGAHTVRVVVKGEEMYAGKGTTVGVEDLIVFRK
jgi:hypothetical protein